MFRTSLLVLAATVYSTVALPPLRANDLPGPFATIGSPLPDNFRQYISAGEAFGSGQCIVSSEGNYWACVQTDGNFVVQQANGVVVWETNTAQKGTSPFRVFLNPNNNLELRDISSNTPIWQTNTAQQSDDPNVAPARLVQQNDANLVIYGSDGKAVWSWIQGFVPDTSNTLTNGLQNLMQKPQ